MFAPRPTLALAWVAVTAIALGAQASGLAGAIVTASVQPETLTVGEPFTVRIRVRASKSAIIRFPSVPDSADAIEAIDPRSIEDHGDDTVLDRTAVYRLVAWDVGSRRPRFGNVVVSQSGNDQQFATNVGAVLVRSLLPADSAERVPKDVRAPLTTPSGLWRYILLLGLVMVGLAWYVWRRIRRRATVPVPEPEARDAATTRFAALERLGLAAAGEGGRHVIAHVDVMRSYFARRFSPAVESLTAEELVAILREQSPPAFPERVGALLERDVGVRFAHAAVSSDDAVMLAREAVAIVSDVEHAHEARLRALDKGPQRSRRGKGT